MYRVSKSRASKTIGRSATAGAKSSEPVPRSASLASIPSPPGLDFRPPSSLLRTDGLKSLAFLESLTRRQYAAEKAQVPELPHTSSASSSDSLLDEVSASNRERVSEQADSAPRFEVSLSTSPLCAYEVTSLTQRDWFQLRSVGECHCRGLRQPYRVGDIVQVHVVNGEGIAKLAPARIREIKQVADFSCQIVLQWHYIQSEALDLYALRGKKRRGTFPGLDKWPQDKTVAANHFQVLSVEHLAGLCGDLAHLATDVYFDTKKRTLEASDLLEARLPYGRLPSVCQQNACE